MSKQHTKNIDDMVAQRRELDRQIRSAKRAEAKAAKAALLSARQDLGVRLAEAMGADTIEDVQVLRAAVESGQIQHQIRMQIGTDSADTEQAASDAAGGDHHDGL